MSNPKNNSHSSHSGSDGSSSGSNTKRSHPPRGSIGLSWYPWGRLCRLSFEAYRDWPSISIGPGDADVWIVFKISHGLQGRWPVIEGDVMLAHAFYDWLCEQPHAWQDACVQHLGIIGGSRVQEIVEQMFQHLHQTITTQTGHVGEYMVEHMTPSRYEISAFCDAVDTFNLDVERMEARLAHVQRRLSNHTVVSSSLKSM